MAEYENPLELRVRELENHVTSLEGLVGTQTALAQQEFNQIHESINVLKVEIKEEFKSKADKDDLSLVQKVVYGAVGVILMAFLTAMIATVVTSGGAP